MPNFKKILIIDNAKIGDLVCATPVFRAIKEKYPEAHLTVLLIPRTEGILRNNRRVNEIMVASLNNIGGVKEVWKLLREIKKRNFDVSINLVPGTLNFLLPFLAGIPLRITSVSRNLKLFYRILSRLANRQVLFEKDTLSIRHYLELLRPIGISNQNLTKEVFTDEASEEKTGIFLLNHRVGPNDVIVGMCLSAGNKIKEWPVENFAVFADAIVKNYGFKIIITGGPKDEPLLKKVGQLMTQNVIITYDDFSLKELPALIKKFDYFVSVDTGPLYIAVALDVPVVDIIGPCSLLDQPPVYEKCEEVHVDGLSCWPCSGVIKPAEFCAAGHLKCIKELGPEMVLGAFKKLVNKYEPREKK